MDTRTLLAQPHLSVITRVADGELTRVQDIVENKVLVEGRADLEAMFGHLLWSSAPVIAPKTLDLIGHSVSAKQLLRLGDWVIDATSPTVSAFFRELADQDVLRRLGIHTVRLLGCRTGETSAARATITALAELLGVEVCGTRALIYADHYDRSGFKDDRAYALVSSTQLRADDAPSEPTVLAARFPQLLDIDTIPETASRAASGPWVHRVATAQQMGEVLRLVRRSEGAEMPGLLAAPMCEVVFPGASPNTFRRAQLLLDGDFVRFYPRGAAAPGVVWAVDDARGLVQLCASLPDLAGAADAEIELPRRR